MQRFGYHLRLDRAHLARLDDRRATGSDCSSELAANETGVAVPRRDEAGDTQRLHHHLGRADTTRKAIVLQNPSHIEEDICRVVSHETGTRDGCTILFDDCFQQFLPMRLHGGVHPPQQGDAFFLARAREGRKGAFGGSDSGACVLLVSEAHPADYLRRRRVVQVEQLGPMRCDEPAVDIDLVDEAHGTLSLRTVMNWEIGPCYWSDKVYNSA